MEEDEPNLGSLTSDRPITSHKEPRGDLFPESANSKIPAQLLFQ